MNDVQHPIVIVVDEIIHTDEHPFCFEMDCPCHDDRQRIEEHFRQPIRDGLRDYDEANSIFYRGKTI